jgi:hypothetical protein
MLTGKELVGAKDWDKSQEEIKKLNAQYGKEIHILHKKNQAQPKKLKVGLETTIEGRLMRLTYINEGKHRYTFVPVRDNL